jgi:hypothetical protein
MEDDLMQGRRLYATDNVKELDGVQPGDYWKAIDRNHQQREGDWMLALPKAPEPITEGEYDIGTLRQGVQDVTEHEDGTITVSPSILQYGVDGSEFWHGYLERGIWREV